MAREKGGKIKKAFQVIDCSGTPYEIGKQWGLACKENIAKSINMHLEAWGSVYHATKEGIFSVAMKFLPMAKEFDPYGIELMKGQAEGAGVEFEWIFTLKCAFEMGEYYKQYMAMCTSFAATGSATRDGKTIIGQNFDWAPGFPADLLRLRHKNGLEQLILSFGGITELTLNSYGLGYALNLVLCPPEEQRINVPTGCVISKAMRQKRIGDALGVFCNAARGTLYHALGSREGDIIGIESTPQDFNVIYPEKNILVHSNNYLTEKFRKGEWVHVLAPDSYIRIQRMRNLMEQHHGNLSAEVMMGILSDQNNSPNAICRHIDKDLDASLHFETISAVIMVPEDGVIYATCGHPCEVEFVEYRLKELVRAHV